MQWPRRLRELLRNAHSREWWSSTAVPFIKQSLFQHYTWVDEPRVDPMAEDWDTLVILDACRYDLFEDLYDEFLAGECTKRFSPGSSTPEFVQQLFGGKQYHDTVYVTANPQMYRFTDSESVFYATDEVWIDAWNDDHDTVLPGTMVERTLAARREFPHKRIISHFVQPHYPFIGPSADELVGEHAGGIHSRSRALGRPESSKVGSVWEKLKAGEVTTEAVWAAYEENLEVALEHVAELLGDLDEKVVVTSDHGNAFGERAWPFPFRNYGHPRRTHTPELITVPWFVRESDDRPDIYSETANEDRESVTDEAVRSRLQDLGYAES